MDEDLDRDYQQCLDGYHVRDQMVQDEFSKVSQLFFLFAGLLLFSTQVLKTSFWLGLSVHVILCLVGLVAMAALLADMQANASCKAALRRRCTELGEQLRRSYWPTIRDRQKYGFERCMKGAAGAQFERACGNYFVFATYMLMVL